MATGGGGGTTPADDRHRPLRRSCKTGADANNSADCARVAVENSLDDYWGDDAARAVRHGVPRRTQQIETFTGGIAHRLRRRRADVGPFYCPVDQTIYLDTTFFDDVLEGQLGGPDGDFVEPYVLAHEYGHHIQNLLGTMGKVKTQQGPTSDAVRLELQADCYAGMWAQGARPPPRTPTATRSSPSSTDDDIDAGARRRHDRRRRPDPEVARAATSTRRSWTHGSAADRRAVVQDRLQQGTLEACDTFAAGEL